MNLKHAGRLARPKACRWTRLAILAGAAALGLLAAGQPLVLAAAQTPDDTISLDDLAASAEQWAQDNLDPDALQRLQQVDRDKVRKALAEFERQFRGDYVIDLAALKDTARQIIPLLEQYEETLPYALWLKVHLDDLEVADQIRLVVRPPEPGKASRPEPLPQKEREIWITRISQRPYPDQAKPYVAKLKLIFTSEHVPPELVWIAEVESSFDPRVRSPAGAAGLFQLMPATAKRYGLSTSWPWDQRVRPEPSARAAARYLYHLHKHFKSWRLALAAYNAGEGTVDNLLSRSKARTYDSIASRLPAETQMYVPKFEAVLLRRENLRLAQLR